LAEKLNKKCIHFWRLDAIWGQRPNSKPVITVDTLQLSSTRFTDEPEGDDNADDLEGGAEASLESPKPKPKCNSKSAGKIESDDHNSDDAQDIPIRRNKSKARGTSTQHGRGGATEGLKRLLEVSEARKEARDEKRIKSEEAREEKRIKFEEAREEKRIKAEAKLQMHRIDSENATAARVAEIQARSNEKMAEMQQESMRMQMRMMEGIFKVMQGNGNHDATT
jgi:hypothetical protein